MKRSQEWQGVTALIDLLIETAEVGQRDRILLEAVVSQPWVEAAALWRPGSDGPEFGARWHQVLSRGPADALPVRDAIHTVVHGERAGDFYPGVRVLQAGAGRGAFALAVACSEAPDSEHELLESLLCLFSVIDGDDDSERELEQWIPLLPAEEGPRIEHDLRNMLTGIQATQDLLAAYGDELSPEELEQFSELIDRECTRAGDLLGHTLGAPRVRPTHGCRPAELLSELIDELGGESNAALHLDVDGDAHAIECGSDANELRPTLRGMLRELHARGDRMRLSLESSGDSDAPALLRLMGASELTDQGAAQPAFAQSLTRAGLRLERDGSSWCVRFPARRSA
jgi:signal transduction histidine kinase